MTGFVCLTTATIINKFHEPHCKAGRKVTYICGESNGCTIECLPFITKTNGQIMNEKVPTQAGTRACQEDIKSLVKVKEPTFGYSQ